MYLGSMLDRFKIDFWICVGRIKYKCGIKSGSRSACLCIYMHRVRRSDQGGLKVSGFVGCVVGCFFEPECFQGMFESCGRAEHSKSSIFEPCGSCERSERNIFEPSGSNELSTNIFLQMIVGAVIATLQMCAQTEHIVELVLHLH